MHWNPNWISYDLKENHPMGLPPLNYDEAIAMAAKMADEIRAIGMYVKLDQPAWIHRDVIEKKLAKQERFWSDKLDAGFVPDRPVNPLLVAWTDPEFARNAILRNYGRGGAIPRYVLPFLIGGAPARQWAVGERDDLHTLPGGEGNQGFLVVGPLKPGWAWKDYVTQGLWLTEPETYDKQKSRPLSVADVKELGYTPDPSDLDKGTQSLVKLKDERNKLKTYEVVRPDDVWGLYTDKSSNRAVSEELRARLGQCFRLSAQYVTSASHRDSDDTKTVLVHGSIQGYGNPRIDHAWVEMTRGHGREKEEFAYDAVLEKWMLKRDYYKLFSARAHKAQKYTQDQVFKNLLTHRHWGPWEPEANPRVPAKSKHKKQPRKR
jgi:hypothetical protein